MKLDIENLTIAKRPSNIKPQTGTGKARRRIKHNDNSYDLVVTGGSKAIWFKKPQHDWIAINLDDLCEALIPVLEQMDFTHYEAPRGSEHRKKVEK